MLEGRLRFGKESKKLRVLLCFSLTLHYLCDCVAKVGYTSEMLK